MGQNSILQWNCRGLKANFNELLILLSLFNPKICCLQETFLNPNDNLEVRNYLSYHYINNDCQRASGGASIMIHSTVPHRKIDLNTNLQAIAIKASLNKSITICSICIPPNKRISQNDLENLLLQLPQPYIICGDFNGHSELWGCSDTNDRGKILEDFITENNLCLFNSNQHTYLHPGSGSFTAIDLSLPYTLIMSGKYVKILMEVIIFLLSCMKLKKQILIKFQNGILKKLTGKNLIFFAMKNYCLTVLKTQKIQCFLLQKL